TPGSRRWRSCRHESWCWSRHPPRFGITYAKTDDLTKTHRANRWIKRSRSDRALALLIKALLINFARFLARFTRDPPRTGARGRRQRVVLAPIGGRARSAGSSSHVSRSAG